MISKFRAWDSVKKEMFKDTFAITESGQAVVVEQESIISSPDYVFVEHLTLSIAQINGKLEIAVLGMEDLFVTDSYFLNLYDAVKPFNDLYDLKNIIDQILEREGQI